MEKIPESVRVGHLFYDIEYAPRIVNGGNDRVAQADHLAQRIVILDYISPANQWESFWHEVIHCWDEIAKVGLKEDVVNRLAPVVAAFMFDNGFVPFPVETVDEKDARYELRRQRLLDENESH